MKNITILGAGLAALIAATGLARADTFVLSREGAQCLADNGSALAASGEAIIFADISVCPPRTSADSGTIETGASSVTTADGEVNNIVIIDGTKVDCYVGAVKAALAATPEGNVKVDFGTCN
jgi:aspartate oxidase